MKNRVQPLLVLLILVFTSCASYGPGFAPLATKHSGKSVVYFYRPRNFMGGGVFGTLKVNGQPVTDIVNKGYFAYVCDPGSLTIYVGPMMDPTPDANGMVRRRAGGSLNGQVFLAGETETQMMINMNVQADKEYFVRVSFPVNSNVLTPEVVPDDVGRNEIVNCRLVPGW